MHQKVSKRRQHLSPIYALVETLILFFFSLFCPLIVLLDVLYTINLASSCIHLNSANLTDMPTLLMGFLAQRKSRSLLDHFERGISYFIQKLYAYNVLCKDHGAKTLINSMQIKLNRLQRRDFSLTFFLMY